MEKKWWHRSVVYQIYPRSFKDTSGNGVGDLRGIIEKLDYLKELGIDVIWLSPVYKSPMDDNGYDISDYQDIAPEFGTMADMDELIEEANARGIRLVMDLVVNHTSDEHPWFIESKLSKDSKKRDWYIWRDGKDGAEPNNWESIFKGSAWQYDENTEQYFLHLFSKRQPDLNWDNEEVRQEIYKMINWWLDKGIDGFRVDAISHIKKEPGLIDMDNPHNLNYVSSFDKHMNVDGIHEYLEELNKNTFSKYDIMTVGEANGVDASESEMWVGEENGKFNMIFQFEHLNLWGEVGENKFNVKEYKKVLTKWQNALEGKGWNALFVENHDIPRVVSSWGNDNEYLEESAKAFALMYFMQKGTPFIYQGQEIGMTNVRFDSIEKYNDVKSINIYEEKINEGVSVNEALKAVASISRDNARTPMQWDSTNYAGFSENTPWIDVNENYKSINVESQLANENSVLNFYKKLIKIRKENLSLIYGRYDMILEEDEKIYAYTRTLDNDKYVVIVNLSDEEALYKYDDLDLIYENLMLANYKVREHGILKEVVLKPYEARLYKV